MKQNVEKGKNNKILNVKITYVFHEHYANLSVDVNVLWLFTLRNLLLFWVRFELLLFTNCNNLLIKRFSTILFFRRLYKQILNFKNSIQYNHEMLEKCVIIPWTTQLSTGAKENRWQKFNDPINKKFYESSEIISLLKEEFFYGVLIINIKWYLKISGKKKLILIINI